MAATPRSRRAVSPALLICTLLLAGLLAAVLAAAPAASAAVKKTPGGTPLIGYNDDFNSFDLHTNEPLDPLTGLPPLPDIPDIPDVPGTPPIPIPVPLPLPLAGGAAADGGTTAEANGGALMKLARSGGADVIRYVVPWARVEREQGTYDFSIEDQSYELALDAGVKPVIVLHTAPCWAHPQLGCEGDYRSRRPDPDYMDEFADFARATIERYPKAVAFEIWNEPNLKAFWSERPTPKAYASMVAAVGKRLEGLGPHAPVLFAGLTPKPKWVKFLKRALGRFGAGDYVDGTAVHPYVGNKGVAAVRKRLRSVQQVVRSVKAPRPTWITEVGWSTNPEAETAVSETQQAARIDRLIAIAPKLRIKGVIVHRLHDVEHSNAWEEGLGALQIDGTPKPIYCALGLGYGPQQRPDGC